MENIPIDVFTEQFNSLPLHDLFSLASTCSYLLNIIRSERFWQIRIRNLYGTVRNFTDLSWKQLSLSQTSQIIKYRFKEKSDTIALSTEKQNGLMAIFTLYLEQNPAETILTEFLLGPSQILDAFKLINTKQELLSLLPNIPDKIGPLELYNLTYSKYELISSFRKGGTSIKLPPYGKSKSVMSYICKYRDYFDSNNRLWRLNPEPKYLGILSTPDHRPWIIALIQNEEFIDGIKLGCEILGLNYSDYLFAQSKYEHYSRR